MKIIPAIDIKGGKCVRLRQGRMHEETIYSDEPEVVAGRWEAQGAELLHVVDLDGAVEGKPQNFGSIRKILGSVRIQVQVGGGLRGLHDIESYMAAGASRVVLGTRAALDLSSLQEICHQYSQKIVVAIDSQGGKVAIRGWQEILDQNATDLAKRVADLPIAALLVTDIHRDGMLQGPGFDLLEKMIHTVQVPIIASGGVRSVEDIKLLLKIQGLHGVIVGRALYEGLLDLKEAIALTRPKSES